MKHRKVRLNRLDKIANAIIIIGLLLLAIPAGFWFNAAYYQWSQSKQWEPLAVRFSGLNETMAKSERSGSDTGRNALSGKNTEAFIWSPGIVDTSTTQPGAAIAFVNIPKLGLRLTVLEGADWANLAKGPVRVSNTARIGDKGTTLISAHRTMYGAPFHDLHKLEPGDMITVYTKKALFVYTVKTSKKVYPKDWRDIKSEGDPYLILSTCEPIFSAEKRLLIISKLTRVYKQAP